MNRHLAALCRCVCIAVLPLVVLAACGMLPLGRGEPAPEPTPTATATLAPTLTPLPRTPTPGVPTPTPGPAATPNIGILDARFVEDITIPDGHVVAPGESFRKIWELRNEGEVDWPEGTVLQHVSGPAFGPVESVSLRPRAPGETAEIAVEMVAPNEPGLYTSYWQLCIEQQCFGPRVWVQIRVSAEE
jgi:hypothetical protein